MSKKLAGKAAVVRADIDEMSEGLNGRALRRDLETMFQLIYLTFTAAARRPRGVRVADRPAESGAGQPAGAARSGVRGRARRAAVSQNHLRARPMTPRRVDQMNLDKSLAFYKDRFADASDFTFVFVGSFDLRDDQAARRALSRQPAVAPPEGSRHGTSASVRRRASSRSRSTKGIDAEEPGRRRLHRPVREQSREPR